MAHAQLALTASDWDRSKVALAKLVQGVERSTRLSEQLLDSARIDARKLPEAAQLVAVHVLVAVVVHDFEMEARERNQTLSLRTEPAEVMADIDDLAILVRNLVDNACRFAGSGAHCGVV
jgi:two-component system OmpR family sensor kinase